MAVFARIAVVLNERRPDIPMLVVEGRGTSEALARLPIDLSGLTNLGMVQTQVTAQVWLGSTPEGRCPQVRGWRAGGSLAVASSTPATPLLPHAKMRELNHART